MTIEFKPPIPRGPCGHPLRDREMTATVRYEGGDEKAVFNHCTPHCRVCELVNARPDRYGQSDAYWHDGEMHWAGIDTRMDAMAGREVNGVFVPWKNHDGRTDPEANAWEDAHEVSAMDDDERAAYEEHSREGEDIDCDKKWALANVRNILAGEFIQGVGEHEMVPAAFNERADRHVGHTRFEVGGTIARITDNNKGRWALRDCIVKHGGQIHFAPSQDLPNHADLTTIAIEWHTDDATIAWFHEQWGIRPKEPVISVEVDASSFKKAIASMAANAAKLHDAATGASHAAQDFAAAAATVPARCLAQGPVFTNGLRHHCRFPLGHSGSHDFDEPIYPRMDARYGHTFSVGSSDMFATGSRILITNPDGTDLLAEHFGVPVPPTGVEERTVIKTSDTKLTIADGDRWR